jgi:hypothetical protein
MRARSIFLLLVAAGVLIAGVAWYTRAPRNEPAPAIAPTVPLAATPDVVAPAASSPTQAAEVAKPREKILTPGDIAIRFHDATDMLAFAMSILDAANAGDGAAQYYMYRAIRRCTSEYGLYFGRNDRERTLDQALIQAERIQGLSPDSTRELYQQCRAFKESNLKGLGEGPVWLDAAVKSRYPLALAAKAVERFTSGFGMTPEASAARRTDGGALAREALRSREPEVIFDLAGVASLTQKGEAADEIAGVWMIAACQRGFDCGGHSEAFRFLCRLDVACQPYETLVDLLRRQLGERFDEFERRARELNDDIDHERFDKIGF